MSTRSDEFMKLIWEARNAGADTEEKLTAAILKIAAENIQFYNAQNDLIVLDKNDMLKLSQELEE